MHFLFLGILLGWGAAIPIGPINLEIIRRNLRFGTRFGVALGCGADFADLTYLVLLSVGAITILSHPTVLKVVGILGSCILAWFGFSALRIKKTAQQNNEFNQRESTYSIWRHFLEGYVLTLFNPYTILFWSSISTQIAALAHKGTKPAVMAGVGVLIGTTSWVLGLNTIVHFTRHRLSSKTMHGLNVIGGIILLAFAAIGFWHALK